MDQKEKVIEEKLYKVIRKKGNHQNTKVNQDGSRVALQFTENNNMDGPLDIIEATDDEVIRRGKELSCEGRTWKQIVWEEIIVPISQEAMEQLLRIGYQHFEVWMEEKAVPAAQKKSKEIGQNMKIILSGVKSAIKGEEPKAVKLIREKDECKNNIETVSQVGSVLEKKTDNNSTGEKIQISQEEFDNIIALTKKSAGTLVGCINLLRNVAVSSTSRDSERQLELQNQLDGLTTSDILGEIDLLLEEKNRDILDDASLKILVAFREGNFLVNEEPVPISNCIGNRLEVLHE